MKSAAGAGLVKIQDLINDAKCFEVVRSLRWPEGVLCSHCGNEHVIKFGRDETQEHRQRYRCKSCGRCFDDLTGTIFEGSGPRRTLWNIVSDRVPRRIEHAVPLLPMITTQLISSVLLRHPHIKLAVVFGSLAAGTARPDSDLDLAVADDKPLSADARIALIADLAEELGRPVDLIDLARAGEPLLGQILTHGRRILGSDERYADLLRRHLIDDADFAPYRSRILAERRRAWIDR